MRRAANFNPEWGYLAPAPSFMRSARLVIVAAAIGATAGAAVVLSLVDRPAAEESVAARTLVRQPLVSASAVAGAPVVAQLQTESQHAQSRADAQDTAQRQAAMLAPAHVSSAGSVASESGTTSTTQRPASASVLAEAPAVTNAPPAQGPAQGTNQIAAAEPAPVLKRAEPAPAQKPPAKKPRVAWRAAPRYEAPRYGYYDAQRYDQRYVQMERMPLAWQRPFGEY
jgi:hypothetical protein